MKGVLIGGRSLQDGGAFLDFPDSISQTVVVRGKTVHFDFDERFGPLLTDEHGEPLRRQPVSERHPFWKPFEAWLAEWRKSNPKNPPRHSAQMNRDPQP